MRGNVIPAPSLKKSALSALGKRIEPQAKAVAREKH
jgi:hypothetical protein